VALRDELLASVDGARQLVDDLGLRTHRVTLRRRTWSGAQVGEGTYTDLDRPLRPTPKIAKPRPGLSAPAAQTPIWLVRVVSKISATYALEDLTGGELAPNEQHLWLLDGEVFWLTDPPEQRNFEWRAKLFGLPHPRVEVLVETPLSVRTDPATGEREAATDSRLVTAHVAALTAAEASASGGLYQLSDVRVLVIAADLPTPPSSATLLHLPGGAHRVVSARQDAQALTWTLTARRGA
jgi:hypothetical protein